MTTPKVLVSARLGTSGQSFPVSMAVVAALAQVVKPAPKIHRPQVIPEQLGTVGWACLVPAGAGLQVSDLLSGQVPWLA